MRKFSKGFTLIELMITVVVIGIISAVAIPQYSEYVKRGAREEAKGQMLNIAQMQERYFTNHNAYLAISAPPAAPPTGWPNFSGSSSAAQRKYDISVAAQAGQTIQTSYIITATPANGFTDSKCGTLTLDNLGAKTKTGTYSKCW